MLFVLSPAKNLNEKDPAPIGRHTLPDLLSEAEQLMAELRQLAPHQLAELMHVSDKIALLNAERNAAWHTPFTPENAKQAVYMFNGDVYEGLSAETLDSDGIDYLQRHVRLLSGLYGLLRPLDLMQPDEAEDVRRLMTYAEYTAGGLMTTEPIILPPEANVATFLAQARKAQVPPALAAVAFVCRPPLEAPTGRFLGMVHLQRALRERPQRMVGSIVDTALDRVHPADSIGTVTRLLATYNLTALPVLDEAGRLVGAVSVDDVLDHLMPDDWREADDEITDEMIERSANG